MDDIKIEYSNNVALTVRPTCADITFLQFPDFHESWCSAISTCLIDEVKPTMLTQQWPKLVLTTCCHGVVRPHTFGVQRQELICQS